MIRTGLMPLTFAFVLATGPAVIPAAAQDQGEAIHRELAGIRKSLEEIVRLLRQRQVDDERSLLLRRIEIKSQRITPIDAAIRDAVGNGRNLESEEARLREWLNDLDRRVTEAEPGPQAVDLREERRQIETRVEHLRSEHWNNQQRILDLEGERRALDDEIKALDAQLERLMPKDR